MPDLSPREDGPACPFCDLEGSGNTVLHRGRDFSVIADHAPLAAAHLLIIPREHFPHLAALPAALDAEFESLKSRLGDFVASEYGVVRYWENGVFGQSVPHAHLHVISLRFDVEILRGWGVKFDGLAGLRDRYAEAEGPYFTIEEAGRALFLPPNAEIYARSVAHAREVNGGPWLMTREERRRQAGPAIEALARRLSRYVEGGPLGLT